MKTKLLSLFVMVMVLLCSCNKADYANVVPADASFVASANVKDIADKGNLQESAAVEMLNQYLGLVVSGKDLKQMKEYIANPADMGIDFREPVFAFKTQNECLGLTMKVASEGDLTEFIQLLAKQSLCTKPVDRDGLNCGSLLDDIEYTFDGKTLLLVSCLGDGGSAMSKQVSAQLMKQDADNSFVSTEAYEKMEAQAGDVKIYSNLGVMPQSVVEQVASILPKGVKKADIEMLAAVNFTNGRATISSSVWGKTPNAQQLIDDLNKNMRKLNAKFIDAPADDFLVWASMGVKGEWLLSKMKEDEQMKQLIFMLERGIDVEQMLRSVDGDFCVILPNSFVSSADDKQEFIGMAEIKDSKFLGDVDYWKQSMKEYGLTMNSVGTDDYILNIDNKTSLRWGVKRNDKELYFGTAAAYNKNGFSPKSNVLDSYADEIKSNQMFVYFNLAQMPMREIGMMVGVPLASNALNAIKAIVIKSASAGEMELVIEAKDKDENFLKQLL